MSDGVPSTAPCTPRTRSRVLRHRRVSWPHELHRHRAARVLHKGRGGLLHVRALAVDDDLVGSKQIGSSKSYASCTAIAPRQFRHSLTYLLTYRVDLLLELLEKGLDERLGSKIKQAVSKYYERYRPCYLLLTD